jgi:ABC-type lipoprotein release transport system permease subunit
MWQINLSYIYWRKHPWWLVSTTLSIAVAVGLTLTTVHLFFITQVAYSNLVLNPLGSAQGHVMALSNEGMFGAWQTILEAMPELQILTPMLSRQTVALYNSRKMPVAVRGIDSDTYFHIHPVVVLEGRVLLKGDQALAMISQQLATQLDINLGDAFEIVTPSGFRSYRVIGISNETSSVVTAPLSGIQNLFTSGERVDGFDLRFSGLTSQTTALKKLQQRFKSVATVMTPHQRVHAMYHMLTVVRGALVTVLGFALIMVVCFMLSFIKSFNTERFNERHVLHIVGVSPGTFRQWRTVELSALVFTAFFLGLAAAVFIVKISLTFWLMATVLGLLTLCGFVCFVVLRMRTRRFTFRASWVMKHSPQFWLSWQLLLALGSSYNLGIIMLVLALTGFTSIGLILQVQQQSLESLMSLVDTQPVLTERTLQMQEEVPLEGNMSKSLHWNMAMMPGVAFVSSRLTRVLMEEKLEENMYVLDLASFPYQSYFTSVEGASSEDLPQVLKVERSLAISESLAKSYSLKAGMGLNLRTPTGQHRYKIVAVIKDIGGVSSAMFIDRHTYFTDWEHNSEGLFLVSLDESLKTQQVADLLREHLNQRYSRLSSHDAAFNSELENLLARLLSWSRWLMLIFILMATVMLRHTFSHPQLYKFMITLHMLGGQRRLVTQLSHNTMLLSAAVSIMAIVSGTLLSYVVVSNLHQNSQYWTWRISGSSYGPSLAIVLLLLVFSRVAIKPITK